MTTKLWNNWHRPELVREGCEESMRKLGVDYLDLFLIHFPVSFTPGTVEASSADQVENVPLGDTWKAMEELVDSLLLIVMVKHEVNALRVKPAFSLRAALLLSTYIAAMFGALQVADRITWAGDEDAAPVVPVPKKSSAPRLWFTFGSAMVATERCLQPHLPPPQALADQCRSLKRGDELDLEQLGEHLAHLGYERVSSIDQEGTWSRRGDIVDIYPVSSELPVRLEFFGEELDKLREFDPATQRSLDPVERLQLTPTGFSPLIADQLRETMPEALDRLLGDQATEELLEGGTPEGMRRLMGLAWQQPASLLDYVPETTCVVIDERRHGLAHGQLWLDHAVDHHREMAREAGLSDGERDELWPGVLHRTIDAAYGLVDACHGFDMAELLEEDNHPNGFDLASRPVPAYPNQFGKLGELIKGYQKEKTAVWLVSAQPSRAVALLEEHDCISRFVPNSADAPAIERLIQQNTPVALKHGAVPSWRGCNYRPGASPWSPIGNSLVSRP